MTLYAFDGTWNDSSVPEDQRNTKKDTNVHRFRVLYDGTHVYLDGVGTRYGTIGRLIGGLTGAGAQKRVEEAFEALRKNVRQGDTVIDVVGYSRGATIARLFVQRIERDYHDLQDKNGTPLQAPPQVRFLGLFDTVASFGIPWTDDEDDFSHLIPDFVENTFHAMALDETRETFGIERCIGSREHITEVWFRGGHGDIGGNATFIDKKGEQSNRERSDIALNWMLSKAKACHLPVPNHMGDTQVVNEDARVTAKDERIRIGNAGTLSRRIHLGDLVHHSLERTLLTRGIDGRLLRRITVPVRIEDKDLEQRKEAPLWSPAKAENLPDNIRVIPEHENNPSLVELSSRRYPFDVPPARTWRAWLKLWELEEVIRFDDDDDENERYLDESWAPTEADRNFAWDMYVELKTRITTQTLDRDHGNDRAALNSVYTLFPKVRESAQCHGTDCGNSALLVINFLNANVRSFTAKWHGKSENDELTNQNINPEFREDLEKLKPSITLLASALSQLTGRRL